MFPYLLDELVAKVKETYNTNNSLLHVNIKTNPVTNKKTVTLGFKLATTERQQPTV